MKKEILALVGLIACLVFAIMLATNLPTNHQQESDIIASEIAEELTSDDEHIEIPLWVKELGYNEEAYREFEKLRAQGERIPTDLVEKMENTSRNAYLLRLYKQTSKLVIIDGGLGTESTAEINAMELNGLEVKAAFSDYHDKKKLFYIVKRLHYHDFSQIVDDHNYVWTELGLEKGKALEIKPETLEIEPITLEEKERLDSLYKHDSRRIGGEFKKPKEFKRDEYFTNKSDNYFNNKNVKNNYIFGVNMKLDFLIID